MADNTTPASVQRNLRNPATGSPYGSSPARARTPLNTNPATNPNIAIRAQTHYLNQSLAAGRISLDDYNQKMGANTEPQSNVNTNQPNPATVNATPFTGQQKPTPTNTPAPLDPGMASYNDALNNLNKGGLTGDALTGAQQSLSNRYQQGHAVATSTGQSAPQSAPVGRTMASSFTPPDAQPAYDSTQTDLTLADNKAHQQFIDDYTKSQTSESQGKSLVDTYSELSNSLGIPSLNTQMMNMKNVIDGSQQDIRDEISKGGGFASDSQVLALTDARNKTLIQNYNNLVTTRDDAEKNLTTMIGLAEQDRTYAQQKISDQLNFDRQNIDYADKALSHAQDVYKTMQTSEGWDGIYKAALASGDPQAVAKINSTMGEGFNLATMSEIDAMARATSTKKTNLEMAQGYQNLSNSKLSGENTSMDIKTKQQNLNDSSGLPNPDKAGKPGYSNSGVKYTLQSATQAITNHWNSSNSQGKDGYVSPQTYNSGLAEWIQNGFSPAEYKAIFGGYVNPNDNKLINN